MPFKTKLNALISERWLSWLKKRRPAAQTFELSQKSTYIFPTRYGFLLLGVLLLMAVGATNYQNNLIFIAAFMVVALGLLCILMTFGNLVGIRFSAHNPEPVYAGQTARFPVSLSSDKHHMAISLGFSGQLLHTVNIEPNQEVRVLVSRQYSKRGRHLIAPVRCQTLFPLGFVQAWSWLFFDSCVIVFPAPIAPPAQHFNRGGDSQDYSDKFQAGIEEFYGLRGYQSGDLMSRIHWKSFAREKGLQTKEFVDYLSEPDVFRFDDFIGIDVETRLSYLSYLLIEANREGKLFGLSMPDGFWPPATGEEHLHQCLTALALFQGPV